MFTKFKEVIRKHVQIDTCDNMKEIIEKACHEKTSVIEALNLSFLVLLSGETHPLYQISRKLLEVSKNDTSYEFISTFFEDGIALINDEITNEALHNASLDSTMNEMLRSHEVLPDLWELFLPGLKELTNNITESVKSIRSKRIVDILELNPEPISEPEKQILFTSNILLTIPATSTNIKTLDLPNPLKEKIKEAIKEEQVYWYDHPIQIGVENDKNEIIYGLRGLNEAIAFEKKMKNIDTEAKINIVLSVSVTHGGLRNIANQYIKEEIKKVGGFEHLNISVFQEEDTKKIVQQILIPSAKLIGNTHAQFQVFGVDGEYSRHYSFLKAITAFWSIVVDKKIKATFKIDLDQIFPQKDLVACTGKAALDHFKTPLWGAKGIDSEGRGVELGMIAGALVNQKDIQKSLFTPDVKYPERKLNLHEKIFCKQIPQAISTEAEMMTRYDNFIDGIKKCIQRVHVTGGTNGILVEALKKFKPFTPTFIGRAEDQAYTFSTFSNKESYLTYAHLDGLIMRHDKEIFATESMKAAAFGKQIGDIIRILYFSVYARILGNFEKLKERIDPFTGMFVSYLPITLTYFAFSLKAIEIYKSKNEDANDFVLMGVKRLSQAIKLIFGEENKLEQQYKQEQQEWETYYNILNYIDADPRFAALKDLAKNIFDHCKIEI